MNPVVAPQHYERWENFARMLPGVSAHYLALGPKSAKMLF